MKKYDVEFRMGKIGMIFHITPVVLIGTYKYAFSIELCWLGYGIGVGFKKKNR